MLPALGAAWRALSVLPAVALLRAAVPSPPLEDGVTRWSGEYTCGQGLTRLSLAIQRRGDELEALFSFGAAPSNPGVPSGSFGMVGRVEGDAVTLAPTGWMVRPDHYATVGLSGRVEDGALRGDVTLPAPGGCTTFELTPAAEAARWLPAGTSSWVGTTLCADDVAELELTITRDGLGRLFASGTSAGRELDLVGAVDPRTGDVVLAPPGASEARGLRIRTDDSGAPVLSPRAAEEPPVCAHVHLVKTR